MNHIKQHLVCWSYYNPINGISHHMQHYLTKEIAKDKMDQLNADPRVKQVIYRCVIFKFKV
jgi:hypothetical protein